MYRLSYTVMKIVFLVDHVREDLLSEVHTLSLTIALCYQACFEPCCSEITINKRFDRCELNTKHLGKKKVSFLQEVGKLSIAVGFLLRIKNRT